MDKTGFCLKWAIIIWEDAEQRTNKDYFILMKLPIKSADEVRIMKVKESEGWGTNESKIISRDR